MSKIVSLSGSHGVGKTSLIELFTSFMNEHENKEVIKVFNEVNIGLHNIGFSLNGEGYDFDEVMFAQKKAFDLGYDIIMFYVEKTQDKRVIFTDRSCVDTYIYTQYFLMVNPQYYNKYKETLSEMEIKSSEVVNKIHHILLPPLNDFTGSQYRLDAESRDKIWEEFLVYFKSKDASKWDLLKGITTQQRYEEVIDLVYPLDISFINA